MIGLNASFDEGQGSFFIGAKDSGLDPIVYDILNEAYHEFRQMYGDKHSDHIKKIIESITDKVEKNILYYFAPIATAHAQNGVRYTETITSGIKT